MPFCIKCGSEISEGANFCPNCGAQLTEVAEASQVVSTTNAIKSPQSNLSLKIGGIIIGIILVVLFVTNPSKSDLEMEASGSRNRHLMLGEYTTTETRVTAITTTSYLLFSTGVATVSNYIIALGYSTNKINYIGILGNWYEVGSKKVA
ncbi:hypothetical protein AGMMS50229_21570 [Campylobacterota bacterium]|nr:hypothetical protein AGMMS50229_21570 [Campylobacterota bacterium]